MTCMYNNIVSSNLFRRDESSSVSVIGYAISGTTFRKMFYPLLSVNIFKGMLDNCLITIGVLNKFLLCPRQNYGRPTICVVYANLPMGTKETK